MTNDVFVGNVLIKKELPFYHSSMEPLKGRIVHVMIQDLNQSKSSLSLVYDNKNFCVYLPTTVINEYIDFLDTKAAKLLYEMLT
jgi:hypothetical protein